MKKLLRYSHNDEVEEFENKWGRFCLAEDVEKLEKENADLIGALERLTKIAEVELKVSRPDVIEQTKLILKNAKESDCEDKKG